MLHWKLELISDMISTYKVWSENTKKRKDSEDLGWEGVDWIHLTQDRDQRWALVNTVMNLRVP
jgi:hypothetical protein